MSKKESKVKYEVISTGSHGNAVLINGVLFDCGVTQKMLKPYLKDIKCVVITHEHPDHLKPSAIKFLASKHVYIHEWTVAHCKDVIKNSRLRMIMNRDTIKYNNTSFKVHDDIELTFFMSDHGDTTSLGCVMSVGDELILYSTDLENTDNIPKYKYNWVFLETNYCEDKIESIIKQAKDRGSITRAFSNKRHLSKQDSLDFVLKNKVDGFDMVKNYIKLHQSRTFY